MACAFAIHGHAPVAGDRTRRWPVDDRRHAGLWPGTGRGQPDRRAPGAGGHGAFNAPTTALGFWHICALSAAALLTAHLVFTLLLTYYKIQRQRQRHRELLACCASRRGRTREHWSSATTPCRLLPPGGAAPYCPVRRADAWPPGGWCVPSSATKMPTSASGIACSSGPSQPGGRRCRGFHHPAGPGSVNSLIEMLADDVANRKQGDPHQNHRHRRQRLDRKQRR